jgi:hypothetical protein
VDKLTDVEFWENEAQTPMHINQAQTNLIIIELSLDPYGAYTILKFPPLFEKANLLDQVLRKVTLDVITEFVVARKENLHHLNNFFY